jgi:hypothetical protein
VGKKRNSVDALRLPPVVDPKDPKPLPVTGADTAFGAARVWDYLPFHDDLPDEFRRNAGEWQALVSRWFFEGLKADELVPKPGIDKTKAIAHCAACMRSWEPKHEHKIRGVAFLMSRWFEPPWAATQEEPAPEGKR